MLEPLTHSKNLFSSIFEKKVWGFGSYCHVPVKKIVCKGQIRFTLPKFWAFSQHFFTRLFYYYSMNPLWTHTPPPKVSFFQLFLRSVNNLKQGSQTQLDPGAAWDSKHWKSEKSNFVFSCKYWKSRQNDFCSQAALDPHAGHVFETPDLNRAIDHIPLYITFSSFVLVSKLSEMNSRT